MDGRVDTTSAVAKILVDNITREFTKISPVESELSDVHEDGVFTDDDSQEFDLFYSRYSDSDVDLNADNGQDDGQTSNGDSQNNNPQQEHAAQHFDDESQEKIETGVVSVD